MTRIIRIVLLLAAAVLPLSACMTAAPEECPIVPGEKVVSIHEDGQGQTGIRGQVTLKTNGQPVVGAYVNIYPDTFSNLLGPSQFLSSPTDEQGRYSVNVPPGTFYVVARRRISGQPTGPLSPGDFYSEHQRIVTQVVEGKFAVVDLEVVGMKAPMFFKKEVQRESDTGIRGRLVDQSGNPVPGGFAMAYSDPELKRLPDYASNLSDADGRFTIYLPATGTYYLAARINAWDMPRPGEPYGIYGSAKPDAVAVPQGTFIEDVVIRMAPFSGEYKPGKSRRPF